MKGNFAYKAKANKKPEAKSLIQQQNAQVVQSKKEQPVEETNGDLKPEKGKKLQKVLGKKKTVRDNKGDEGEVTDKRDTVII